MKKFDPTAGPAPMPDKGVQARLDNPIAREVSAHSGATENKQEQHMASGGVPKDNLGARRK